MDLAGIGIIVIGVANVFLEAMRFISKLQEENVELQSELTKRSAELVTKDVEIEKHRAAANKATKAARYYYKAYKECMQHE